MKGLNDAAMELGKAAYEASKSTKAEGTATGETGSATAGTKGKDDVIDAEYEVKDGT